MTETINNKILKLWVEHYPQKDFGENEILMPMLYPELPKDSLLFIGINPSYDEKYIVNPNDAKFYDFKQYRDLKTHFERKDWKYKLIKMEEGYLKKHPHYKMFQRIAEYLSLDSKWVAIDLFFEREKRQNDLVERYLNIKDCNGNDLLKSNLKFMLESIEPFAEKQLELSLNLIKERRPKVIVVANALASKILLAYNNQKGKRVINTKDFDDLGYWKLFEIPIFFCSSFRGNGALNIFSRLQLVRNIKHLI